MSYTVAHRPDILTDLGINRSERRKLIRDQAKRLSPFQFEQREVPPGLTAFTRVWASGVFWAMEKGLPGFWRRLLVGRHDKAPGITWSQLQRVKNEIYGKDVWALQCFPPEEELSNEGNIYWLHAAPAGWSPEWQVTPNHEAQRSNGRMEYDPNRDLKDVRLPNGDHFDKHDWQVYSQEFRRKPVVIKALKLEIPVLIETREGLMTGDVGDYLIQGVAGEFYICKPEIFKQTYERMKE